MAIDFRHFIHHGGRYLTAYVHIIIDNLQYVASRNVVVI